MNENRPHSRPEDNQRSKSARFALAWAGDSLFDYPATEIGSDQTSLCIPYRPAQREIGDGGLVGKTHERLGFEGSHHPHRPYAEHHSQK